MKDTEIILMWYMIYIVYMFCTQQDSLKFWNYLAQSKNSYFAGRSRNSYFAQDDSGIAPAQRRNRDKVSISMYL